MSFARRLKSIHLRLVLQVALTGKLQAAAEEIALSQPAASRMLAEIEKLVGAALFTRHAKGMVPTPIGEAVVRHARQILQDLDKLDMDVAQIASGRAGSVRIGTVTGPAVGLVVPVVRAMRAQAPEVEFNIEVAPSTTLMRGLDEGIFDFVVARLAQDYQRQSYRIYPANREVISMLVYGGHPMAQKKSGPSEGPKGVRLDHSRSRHTDPCRCRNSFSNQSGFNAEPDYEHVFLTCGIGPLRRIDSRRAPISRSCQTLDGLGTEHERRTIRHC